jgi:hypothetical protein
MKNAEEKCIDAGLVCAHSLCFLLKKCCIIEYTIVLVYFEFNCLKDQIQILNEKYHRCVCAAYLDYISTRYEEI